MELLSKERLICTGPVDHADWNYKPLLAYISRRRFALVEALLDGVHAQRMLEIGFGSGVFMPELSTRTDELYGIDVHDEVAKVERHLAEQGVQAQLSRQSATNMMFEDRYFDAAVAVSSLEFIENFENAAREIARILSDNGRLIAVMPAKSKLLDFTLRTVTGEDAERDYGGRRERVLPTLRRHFTVVRTKQFFPVYTAYELRPYRLC